LGNWLTTCHHKKKLFGNLNCDLGTVRLSGINLAKGKEMSNEDSRLECGIVYINKCIITNWRERSIKEVRVCIGL